MTAGSGGARVGGSAASGGTRASGGTTSAGGTATTGGTAASSGSSGGSSASGGTSAGGATPPSCSGLSATCGPSGNENCCTSLPVPGGTFYRSYDDVTYTSMTYPATVDAFFLDKYEITVGRFRQFVNAGMGTQANPPAAGAGTHPLITGSGWDSAWNTICWLTAAHQLLNCGYGNNLDRHGGGKREPCRELHGLVFGVCLLCVGWGTAADRGRVELRGRGGSEQRAYPWSSPATSTTIDDSYAVYCGRTCKHTECRLEVAQRRREVGSGRPGRQFVGVDSRLAR